LEVLVSSSFITQTFLIGRAVIVFRAAMILSSEVRASSPRRISAEIKSVELAKKFFVLHKMVQGPCAQVVLHDRIYVDFTDINTY
jgi:hypothetical protein